MKLIAIRIEKVIEGENKVFFPVLIQNENRKYLVDCGYEETFEDIRFELSALNIGIKDITGIIITHDDYDHLGGLKLFKQNNSRLKIYCGEYEKDSVSGILKSERLVQAESSLETVPDEHKQWAMNFIHKLKSVQRFKVNGTLADKDVFEEEIVVIHTPGHTKGHISLFYARERTLIAGDAIIIENGELNIANPLFTLDMEAAVKSVEKIKKLNPQKIICYHGGILDKDVDEKLGELIDRYKNINKSQQ